MLRRTVTTLFKTHFPKHWSPLLHMEWNKKMTSSDCCLSHCLLWENKILLFWSKGMKSWDKNYMLVFWENSNKLQIVYLNVQHIQNPYSSLIFLTSFSIHSFATCNFRNFLLILRHKPRQKLAMRLLNCLGNSKKIKFVI